MKKTLSVLAVLGIIATASMQTANAFTWSNLNPATWFGSGKCGCEKPKCGCEKHKKCDPCATGYAAPCEVKTPCTPCQKAQPTCDPCDRLQQMNR